MANRHQPAGKPSASPAWYPCCLVLCFFANSAFADAETEALREELQLLKQRLEQLEARLAAAENRDIEIKEAVNETAVADSSGIQAFDIGGALRFNYSWKDFDDSTQSKRGDIGLDIFRLNVDGQYENILLSAEYRFYSFMDTIHHGWIGYDFGEHGQVQAGITQVPFGLLPFASHSFWFGTTYYIGLEDDYDMGIKYINDSGPWNLQLAAFKNAELGNADDLERYSYDPVTTGAARNEETNTFNGRLAYTFGKDSECSNELGLSGQWGELFNRDTDDSGDHWAAAAHLDSRCGRWNLQLELGRYEYNPRNPAGVSNDSITFGAFAFAHEVAAEGYFGVANIAYNVPVNWPRVDVVTCYNDFSILHKDERRFNDSLLNTTGCLIGIGPTFTYIDLIRGRNALFLGDGSLAGGGNDEWETRININLGYYW